MLFQMLLKALWVGKKMFANGEDFQMPDGLASVSRGFANQTPIRELAPVGLTNTLVNLNPAPGSADLIEARQAHGQPGHEQAISIIGAVTGRLSNFTNKKTNAPARAVGQAGIVTGFAGAGTYGGDQGISAAQAYLASQAQMITDQASASALYAKL